MIGSREWQGARTRRFGQVLVILLALSGSLILGLRGSQQIIAAVLGGIIALFAALLAFVWPPVGLLGLIVLSFFIPFTIGTGTATELNLSTIGLAGLVGLYVVQVVTGNSRRSNRVVQGIYLPLIAFIIIAGLAFLVGQLPWYPVNPAPLRAQLGQLGVLVLLPCLVLIVDRHIRDELWLKRLTWLFLGFASLQLVLLFLPALRSALAPVLHRGASGSLFWVWTVSLAFGQAVFNEDLSKVWRFLLGGVTALSLYLGLVLTFDWASGWLPPLIALLGVIWAAKPRLAAVLSAILFTLAVIYASEAFDLLLINEEYSAVTRLEAWKIVTRMVMERSPLLGFGPANYRFYTVEHPILGWNVVFNSHNQYVDLLAQTGLLGTGAFLWYSVATGKLLWNLRSSQRTSAFFRALNFSLFGGLVGMLASGMLADWFLPFVYNITLSGVRAAVPAWIFLGAALSLYRISTDQAELSPER